MSNYQFTGKVVWVTGASSGIGKALALAFNKKGARVIISARNTEALERVKQSAFDPANVFTLPLDLSDAKQIKSAAAAAINLFGRIDCLVNNAGITARDLADNTTIEVDRKLMETNYFGPITLTKAILPFMLRQGYGQLVVISSLSGKYGVPKLSAYAASKHALHGFFESIRAEYYSKGIRITMVVPGFIKTPIITNGVDGKGERRDKDLGVNEKGMTPAICARRILHAIEMGKQEVLIGGPETITVFLNRLFPRLLRWMMRNHPIKRMKRISSVFTPIFKPVLTKRSAVS